MDCSPPGPSVHGILQARILEWVAISSFRGSSQPVSLESPAFASEFKRHLGSPVHLYAYLKKKKKNPNPKINCTPIQKLKTKKSECYWHVDKLRIVGMDEKTEGWVLAHSIIEVKRSRKSGEVGRMLGHWV